MTRPTLGAAAAHAFAALRDPGRAASREALEDRIGISDAQLVALARESRGEALERLYAAYRIRIHTFVLRLLGDVEAAEDLTQDVFTRAYHALPRLAGEGRVRPWLYRIAYNASVDAIRRRRRFTWLRIGKLDGTRDEPLMPDEHGRVGEREQLQRILRTLPPEQSTALVLHALEGYTYTEIAEIQGCTMTAVRSRIARARAAFRDRYATTEAPRSS